MCPCPCCGYLTSSSPGSHDICPICAWEDDLSQLRFTEGRGVNGISLIEAQENFAAFGACKKRALKWTRPPGVKDVREPGWRPIDLAKDHIERQPPDVDQGSETYPGDLTQLYYWRSTYWRH